MQNRLKNITEYAKNRRKLEVNIK